MSKGKKPPRPLSKATIALNLQLARKRGIRQLPKRFLIVCEDEKSARDYFDTLKVHFDLSAASVEVVGSKGRTQPLQVVERAVDLKEAAEASNGGTDRFDQVWCVIDGDFGTKINNARKKATANDVKLAISTKCFEYWVLLHFLENDSATLDCDGTIHALNRIREKRNFPKYDKGRFDFSRIVADVQEASKRARKLREPQAELNIQPENQNPCSEVYLLIEAILNERPG